MNRKWIGCWLGAVLLLCGARAMSGQEDSLEKHEIVRGEPYSATRRITTEQPGSDGKPIRHIEIRWEARNSEGWEWSRSPVETKGMEITEQQQIAGTGPMNYVLYNPATRQRIAWCSCGRKASTTSFKEPDPPAEGEQAIAPLQASLKTLTEQLKGQQFTLTQLDPKWILNQQAEGMRATQSGGSGGKMLAGIEVWYAPSLHLALSTVVADENLGVTSNSVIVLSPSEPDPALFKMPVFGKVPRQKNIAMAKATPVAGSTPAAPSPSAAVPAVADNAPMSAGTVAGSGVAAVPAADAGAVQVAAASTPEKPAPAKVATQALPELVPGSNAKLKKAAAAKKKPDPPLKVYKNAPPGWPPGLPPL